MSNMSLNCEGDTEQTQKLLQAREIEWEARPKKKSPPLVTSGWNLKCRQNIPVDVVSRNLPCGGWMSWDDETHY